MLSIWNSEMEDALFQTETKPIQKREKDMLPLKLVRSLVLGETINRHPLLLSHSHNQRKIKDPPAGDCFHDSNDNDTVKASRHCKKQARRKPSKAKTKIPLLLFIPTKELVADTYRLATIARDLGMDLYPTPSLSHIVFSCPSSSSSASSPTSSSSSFYASSRSSFSMSSSLSWPLPNDAVLLSFPSLSSSSLSHLRSFVSLSKGLFKLVFITRDYDAAEAEFEGFSDWDCCSISLFSRLTNDRIDSLEAFSRALAGRGWTLFKTRKNPSPNSEEGELRSGKSVFLFRKVDSGRVRGSRGRGECRIRELRLPALDFRNVPLRILQYVVLMTDDVFYLA